MGVREDDGPDWKECMAERARELGFVRVGFAKAERRADLEGVLLRRERLGLVTPFVRASLRQRTDPREVWPECRTVMVLAYPFPLSLPPLQGEGVIARSAVGEDYHAVLRKKLAALEQLLRAAGWPGREIRQQVDTGPLVERFWAVQAGVGWIGRNQQLIVPGVGSFLALALLLLDRELAPNTPVPAGCGECGLCLEACPAQILGQPDFRADRCLSYLTQTKEVLSGREASLLGNRIFGCDTCQEVCPHNRLRLRQEASLYEEIQTERRRAAGAQAGDAAQGDPAEDVGSLKEAARAVGIRRCAVEGRGMQPEPVPDLGAHREPTRDAGAAGDVARNVSIKPDSVGGVGAQENAARDAGLRPNPVAAALLFRGVDLFQTLLLTKPAFREKFGWTAAGWRGKGILQRNAFLALKNAQDKRLRHWLAERKQGGAVPPLIEAYGASEFAAGDND
ncbi:Epoxyqueuosine reductase QueG [Acididesulfobacillus acetoxydans]|uniref:Epoxyqueuosine reductase QueG n=1 Tax=Acididesulfobacillus acetoxydans TaxID=1561005 RepID=A0A8S0WPZ7_9FIRM|nr:tRNA epoxyqueuosine(34) reductase QueG [Acididesulfobacillus acetoxydans]CAA7602284.1 Epoxyqueuosine reductase QueG [Acididesulfobacillus acetoxydans]CEJ07498.1 TIGR00276: epoxyqueuosine reductase [Acididesulfobacillus acetoxydans]